MKRTRALICPICMTTQGNRVHQAREMFLGTRDIFIYGECAACGALWLPNPPDLARYYQHRDYIPLRSENGPRTGKAEGTIRALLADAALKGVPLARLKDRPHWSELLRAARANRRSAILDVGTGSGSFLRQLQRHGFSDLTGIDPFLEAETSDDGMSLKKVTLTDFSPRRLFDVVFLNDVFEHVPDPRETLHQIVRLLAPMGTIIIRIPMADSYAWRTYGTDWFALDPPRHLVIQTRASMNLLAKETGLTLSKLIYDSGALQFLGSELYKRGIAFNDPAAPTFSDEDLRGWTKQAEDLNARQEGDHATFLLRCSNSQS